jgi:hypothetical protein
LLISLYSIIEYNQLPLIPRRQAGTLQGLHGRPSSGLT